MVVLEMFVDPFQRQCILASKANGQVIIAVISKVFNNLILLVNFHCWLVVIYIKETTFPSVLCSTGLPVSR